VSFDDGTSRIGSDPFATPIEAREPARRLRGRLAMPVTVWTSQGVNGVPSGITVSSVLIADGSPAQVLGLVDPLSDFSDQARETGRFLVHVLTSEQMRLAEKFALKFPGDPFDGLEVRSTTWGPALTGLSTRAACTLLASTDIGYAALLQGRIDHIELDEGAVTPLVHYRGRYVSVGPLRSWS
jgi:3-hydroxy-9,10-secoandrosta-1,3,5(10)-triene-9,17-dione monooxygenase reductase component